MNQRRVRRMLAALESPLRIIFRGRTIDLAPGRLIAVPSPVPSKPFLAQLADAYSVQLRPTAEAERLAEMFLSGELQDFLDQHRR